MEVETLIRIINELDRNDKLLIAREVERSIAKERDLRPQRELRERFEQCRKAAEECTHEDFFSPTRRRMVVLTRCMVAYSLLNEGYVSLHMQGLFGKDHSTIFHMKQKMETILEFPSNYCDEYDIYCKYIKKINETL